MSYVARAILRAAQTLSTVTAPRRNSGAVSTVEGECGRVCASCEGYMIREKMGAVGWLGCSVADGEAEYDGPAARSGVMTERD